MRRVLVTGARGFIGRHAVNCLRARGYEVHAVTSRPPPEDAPPVHWHRVDLLAPGAAEELSRRVVATHLLHFAWFTEPGAFWTSSENERWVAASLDLLAEFAAAGGYRAVVAGSCAEYDWNGDGLCVEGGTALIPATPYGEAKLTLCRGARGLADARAMSLAWGRIFFTFGPDEHPDRLVSSMARSLVRGESVETTSGEQVRDFIYAPELADAFAATLDSTVEGALNVASGEGVTVRSLVERIAAAAGRPELLRIGARAPRPGEPSLLVAATHRLAKEVGWTPSLSLDHAIERTVAWWRHRESKVS